MEKRKRYLLIVLWLAGMLLSVRGLMASDISLLAAMLVGAVVSGARLAAEKIRKQKNMSDVVSIWEALCVSHSRCPCWHRKCYSWSIR